MESKQKIAELPFGKGLNAIAPLTPSAQLVFCFNSEGFGL
jgi:hypothetical protein